MLAQPTLIDELEDAVKSGSQDKRVSTLRRVTDLFLNQADRLNEAQIAVFDDVLCHLVSRIEAKALVELSSVLAPIDNAPTQVIRKLARDDDIAVAEPVLTQSEKLTTQDLVEIAQEKSQAHLAAIAGRNALDAAITDVLVERGDRAVKHRLASNFGAQFSDNGYAALVRNAEGDDSLAKAIGLRVDLPLQLLRSLLEKATEAVREWLLASAPADKRESIKQALQRITGEVAAEVSAPRDYSQAMRIVEALKAEGKLAEDVLLAFATASKYEEMVAALAALCAVPVKLIVPLIKSPRLEGLLVACKAGGIKWPTVTAILQARIAQHTLSRTELAQARSDYLKLSADTARRTLRFWAVRAETK
jgi:uncharacterized protein (DUF2336 family)